VNFILSYFEIRLRHCRILPRKYDRSLSSFDIIPADGDVHVCCGYAICIAVVNTTRDNSTCDSSGNMIMISQRSNDVINKNDTCVSMTV